MVSWNIAMRFQVVDELLSMNADVALLQDVGPVILEILAAAGGNVAMSLQGPWEPWQKTRFDPSPYLKSERRRPSETVVPPDYGAHMPTQSEALRLMLEAISAMREAGYTQEDIQELAGEAWTHLERSGHQPHAFGHCINCGRVIVGWSVYQWSILVREPCPRCGKAW